MGGVGSARNVGLANSQGKYIYFMDPDDEILENLLLDNVLLLEKYHADLVIFDFVFQMLNGKVERHKTPNEVTYLNKMQFKNNFIDIFKVFSMYAPVNKLYSNKIKKMNLKFNQQSVGEDAMFNMDYFRLIDSVVLNPEAYYISWERGDSLTHNFSDERIIESFKIHRYFKSLLEDWNLDSNFADSDVISFVFNVKDKVDKKLLRKMYFYVIKNCHKNIKNVVKLTLTLPKIL